MSSPEAYYNQLSKFDGMMLEVSTADEAKAMLKSCREYQKQLRQLKKEANLDIKARPLPAPNPTRFHETNIQAPRDRLRDRIEVREGVGGIGFGAGKGRAVMCTWKPH